jgi:hypothetical protein
VFLYKACYTFHMALLDDVCRASTRLRAPSAVSDDPTSRDSYHLTLVKGFSHPLLITVVACSKYH